MRERDKLQDARSSGHVLCPGTRGKLVAGRAAASSTARWQGRAHIGRGWAAFLGTAGDNHPHAHHAVQLVVAFGPPVILWTSAGGEQAVTCAIVPSDLTHALLPSDIEVGLLYVDAESAAGRSLSGRDGRLGSPAIGDVDGIRSAFTRAIGGEAGGFGALLAQCALPMPDDHHDDRVAAVLTRLDACGDLSVTVADMAAWAHLSPSRFAHRFVRHTGMPLRPYLRWLRLQRAAAAMIAGASATTAAHAAGFADAAHLSRTLRRHFGITPATLTDLRAR